MLTFTTYDDLRRDVLGMLPVLRVENFDAVIGIPRSGLLPASIIATDLSLPLGMLGNAGWGAGQRLGIAVDEVRKILLVDDSMFSGKAMWNARLEFSRMGLSDLIKTAVVYQSPKQINNTDFHARVIGSPRCFEWNLWNSWVTKKGCFDMDGVICHDPVAYDDDGPKYENALQWAQPKHFPFRPYAIVTHRLERWRGITESWLAAWGIETENLIMAPHKTANERRADPDIQSGKWKADWYIELGAKVFVESHDKWAVRICNQSGKPTISLESRRAFNA